MEKLLEGLRDVVLNSAVLPDWQDVGAACRLHLDFAGDEGRNYRRSTAGMDCLWDTSGCVQNSKPPCGNHLENHLRKTRCKHHDQHGLDSDMHAATASRSSGMVGRDEEKIMQGKSVRKRHAH